MIPPLTRTEADTLATIRGLSSMVSGGRSVKTATIIDRNWKNGRGLTYDQTTGALRTLRQKGYIERVVRGYYREVDRPQ